MDLPIELRFENTKYNYLFTSILCILLPSLIFISSFTFSKKLKVIGIISSLILSIPCAVTFLFTSNSFKQIHTKGIDLSFEKIKEIELNDSKYRLYRTNGGATTSFGLVLRKETLLIKGINIVEVMFYKYKASESSLTLINEQAIELRIEPYQKNDKAEVIKLTI